ncbi:MAG: phosphoglucosamine mutase [Candidatus Pacebacteria bacterium]|nr:phosphoglucosamine mutase [Candidatus Paceibacterota bacterium]
MRNQPNLTVSGYRGIWGKSLNNGIVENYTKAFIKFVRENTNDNPTILIGRDGRESGTKIKETIIKTLFCLGVHYVDGDILPTPTVLFAVNKNKYDGAIIITASHNPREYNGFKFVTNKALFANEAEVEKIKLNYDEIVKNKKFSFTSLFNSYKIALFGSPTCIDIPTTVSSHLNFTEDHANQILKNINVEKIKSQKFKVAVDMINASACVLDPYLFEKLGVELIPLNNIPNGKFAHKPEPLKENLEEIANLVKENKCDIGFAHDPDADRLVVINEKGNVISEEYTLTLGVGAVLSKNLNNKIVINMSTSQMNNDVALKYGGQCIRTKVGEANVVAGIIENNAIIGGEGGGGVIYPAINMARDSFVSLALILELLAERNQTISECVDSLPKYEVRKDKLPLESKLDDVYAKMKKYFKGTFINESDGLRLDFSDGSWIHLRPSNTEPIIRLIGEAKTKERIDELFEEVKKLIY